jgi:hypothetical protein
VLHLTVSDFHGGNDRRCCLRSTTTRYGRRGALYQERHLENEECHGHTRGAVLLRSVRRRGP